MTGGMTDVLWLALSGLIAAAAALMRNRLHGRYESLTRKHRDLRDRTETFANYIKLAGARVVEAEERRKELADEAAAHRKTIDDAREAAIRRPDAPSREFHVFDRVAGRKGDVWAVVVESRAEGAPWSGIRHYVVVAETPEDARTRVRDRFPSISGFSVSEAEKAPF